MAPSQASMQSGIHIRHFEAGDQQEARQVVLTGFGDRFGFINEELNPDLDDIMQTYIAAGNIFVVACVGSELVATGALVGHQPDVSEMGRISPRKDYRRRGIAAAIITYLID